MRLFRSGILGVALRVRAPMRQHLFHMAKIDTSACPAGSAERGDRVRNMVGQMEAEGFGGTNAVSVRTRSKGIGLDWIAK